MFLRKLWMALVMVVFASSLAYADLDAYLKELDIHARADFGDFRAQVEAHFGVPAPDLDLVFKGVFDPADAVICLWLGQQSRQPYDVVMREYRANKGKGWGVVAQRLGIKPGSAQFKALKAGDLGWSPRAHGGGSAPGGGKGDGHGGPGGSSGKGHGKNK
ncbi:MAG: hypothetical protein FDZ69_09475 [Deltaproteobacteria bacterium]|nr:MAG: hypothetical protein FDZ69_09475 [Deltaproteobacteria bacterium]